ncbi:MAG TPA: ornithine carbamoyltransferase [Gammaproteobacteria bacterium]|nr:ornithine carbamoyltransferase [Gammaproteobacteria bacterium]
MKSPQHYLTGEELSSQQTHSILKKALLLKKNRHQNNLEPPLQGQHLALLFDKPSLRTRFSFTIAMRELGGNVVESLSDTRKKEQPEDQAKVLGGYCQAIMVRTFADDYLERMGAASPVSIINGLSNLHHPCQILADMLTLLEVYGALSGLTLAYIGDGNNILHSLLLIAPTLGVNVHYCCPESRGPDASILARASKNANPGTIKAFSSPEQAVNTADAVYTDTWTSMGFEGQNHEYLFNGFQVDEQLMAKAKTQAVFMHCLPMERGKEVSHTLPDLPCSVIFHQSENRLHVQKALLLHLLAA